ncbi:tripartite tricarboxylate transporter permease [soil metagenome]|jgi:putative tricarboxylic transport membrane protein|nr:tripartite tricarboxylate transporter permease [Deinococcota bacterium]
MDVLQSLMGGFSVAMTPTNLFVAFIGVLLGTIIGMLPGIGPINGIAILIPITFALGLEPTSMLILFSGIYYGSQYGNSISTILLNVPGTASSVATALDGYEMSKQGRAGPALAISAIASFIGGTLSVVGLMLFAPLLAQWAIRFGPAEYFVLIVFTFSTLSALTGKHFAKGLIATAFGLMLAMIGLDPGTGIPRYTFGQLALYDGLDFVVVTIGFFAVSEVFMLIEGSRYGQETMQKMGRVMISSKEFAASWWVMIRSSVLGFMVGVLPGAGATIASFLAYTVEQRLVDRKGTFGSGDIRGVAAPEAANNASVSGALIPLLTLGVPGSGTTAVILGALLALNLTPGPLFIARNPELFWGLVASMYIGNVMLLILNLPLVGLFVKLLLVPRWILVPAVATISYVAVYAVNSSVFDLMLMTAFGVVGYAMRKMDFPVAPVILALVLGPLMEVNLRRALSLSNGDPSILVGSPLAIGLWVMVALSLVLPFITRRTPLATVLPEEEERDDNTTQQD